MNIPYDVGGMIFYPVKSYKEVMHAACRSNFDPLFSPEIFIGTLFYLFAIVGLNFGRSKMNGSQHK